MKHIPIKLGPLALLLAVISICMTTLGILSFTTARADWNLAQGYADTVWIRYSLESQGQGFLRAAEAAIEKGSRLESLMDVEVDENGVAWRTFTEGEFRLRIGIVEENGSFRVVNWRMQKEWELDEDMNLWLGE